jgi:hypothetical protein
MLDSVRKNLDILLIIGFALLGYHLFLKSKGRGSGIAGSHRL